MLQRPGVLAAAEPGAAPDRGRITVSRDNKLLQRPRQVSFGVRRQEPALAISLIRWDNECMKIAIELNTAQTERLQAIATSLGVNAEELAQAAVADLVSAGADDIEAAVSHVLQKNRELYQRLAK
jgi:hypothetical protein